MRVTQRTPDTLVVEEGLGGFAAIAGWTNEKWLFVIVGAIFALFGLKILLFGRTRTPRFERWRGMLAIDSKGLLRSDRREREIDLNTWAKTSIEGSKHSV